MGLRRCGIRPAPSLTSRLARPAFRLLRWSPVARRFPIIAVLDAGAVALFAFEGGLLAADASFDLLGVLVVAVASSLAGGVLRDLLIGDVPPAAVRHTYLVVLAVGAGLVAFGAYRLTGVVSDPVVTALDAGGLALFAVAGAAKALDFRLGPFMAVLLGGLTAVGGGVVRDLLLDRVPTVLTADVYATAALVGATVAVVGLRRRLTRWVALSLGALACFALRLLSASQGWHLPTAR